MCKPTITAKVEERMELRKHAEELQNQMEAITDEIKAYTGDATGSLRNRSAKTLQLAMTFRPFLSL